MSTRRRTRPRTNTYTDRLYRRGKKRDFSRAAAVVTHVASRRVAALLVLVVELGHLGAALVEWPAAVPRGVFHVVAAALAGVLAVVVYYGRTRIELLLGLLLAVALPTAWLAGLSPYRDYPTPAVAVLSAIEIALAVLLAVLIAMHAPEPLPPPPSSSAKRHAAPQRQRVRATHRS